MFAVSYTRWSRCQSEQRKWSQFYRQRCKVHREHCNTRAGWGKTFDKHSTPFSLEFYMTGVIGELVAGWKRHLSLLPHSTVPSLLERSWLQLHTLQNTPFPGGPAITNRAAWLHDRSNKQHCRITWPTWKPRHGTQGAGSHLTHTHGQTCFCLQPMSKAC